jgi:hypothetical protein
VPEDGPPSEGRAELQATNETALGGVSLEERGTARGRGGAHDLLAAGMVLEETARVGACIGGWRTMDHHEEDVQNYRRFPSICPHAHMGKAQRTKKHARRLFPFLDLLLVAKSGPNPAR